MTFDTLRAIALMPELGPAWPLAFVLADMLFKNDGKLFPSIDRLCARTGYSRAKVKRDLATLRKLGYLIDTGARYGKTESIRGYRLNLPTLAALQKRMERRVTETLAQAASSGLTDEPTSEGEAGSPVSPLKTRKQAQNRNGSRLICSTEAGSPVSHISSKSKQKKQTGRCAPRAREKTARAKAPPSASGAALPGDEFEESVQRSKKLTASAESDESAKAALLTSIDALTAHLSEKGINSTDSKAQAVVKRWANDPRVTLDVIDEGIARLQEEDNVRSPMALLPYKVDAVLFEREHPAATPTLKRANGTPSSKPLSVWERKQIGRAKAIKGMTGHTPAGWEDFDFAAHTRNAKKGDVIDVEATPIDDRWLDDPRLDDSEEDDEQS